MEPLSALLSPAPASGDQTAWYAWCRVAGTLDWAAHGWPGLLQGMQAAALMSDRYAEPEGHALADDLLYAVVTHLLRGPPDDPILVTRILETYQAVGKWYE